MGGGLQLFILRTLVDAKKSKSLGESRREEERFREEHKRVDWSEVMKHWALKACELTGHRCDSERHLLEDPCLGVMFH